MALSSHSLAQRLEAVRLPGWQQSAPCLGWLAFRWLAWSFGLAVFLSTGNGMPVASLPLVLLGAATLLALASSYLLPTRIATDRILVAVAGLDLLAAALLVRFTGGLESAFLAYSLAPVMGLGWRLGPWAGGGSGLALATLGATPPPQLLLGSYVVYATSAALFGSVASWLARYAELVAERDRLDSRVELEVARVEVLEHTLHRVQAQVLGSLDPNRLYPSIANTARDLLHVPRVAVLVADESTGELRLAHQVGFDATLNLRRFAVPISGPADWAGEPERLCELLSDRGLPTTLAEPMRLHDRLLGVLAVQADPGRVHSRMDCDALGALARLSASALANARAYMERVGAHRREGLRQAELSESLLTVQAAIAAIQDEDEICRRVSVALATVLPAERSGVFLLSDRRDVAHLVASHGLGWDEQTARKREFALLEERPLAVRAMHLRKLLTAGSDEPELLLAPPDQSGAAIAAPLLVGDELVGALFAEASSARRWREPEQRYLRLLAQQAGLSLRRARTSAVGERRASQVQGLLRAAQVINSELEPSAVLESIAAQAAATPGAHFGGLVLIDANPARLRAFVGHERERRELGLDLEHELFASVIATREARLVTRAEDLPPQLSELGRLAAGLVMPVLVSQRVIGLLVVGWSTVGRGAPEYDLRFLRYLADQASLAISRTRLHEQAQVGARYNAALVQTSQVAASSLDLRDTLRTIAACATDAVHAERASVYLYDGRQFLTPVALVGFGEEVEQAFGNVALDVDQDSFTRELTRQKRPIQVESRSLAHGRLAGWPLLEPDVRRVLGVPMIAGERVLGALFVHERHARRTFTTPEIDLLLTIGRQAAGVVESDELSEQERQARQRERLLALAGRELSSGHNVEQRLTNVLEHLAEVLPIRAASVARIEQHELKLLASYGAAEHHPRLPRAELPEGRQMVDWLSQEGRPYLGTAGGLKERDSAAWSYLAVPLMAGSEALGILQLESERAGAFGERELTLVSAVATEIATALGRERMRTQLQELGRWKTRALEARDTQEAAGRMLASAIIKLGATDMMAAVDREQALEELRQAKDLAASSLEQLRRGLAMVGPGPEPSKTSLPTTNDRSPTIAA